MFKCAAFSVSLTVAMATLAFAGPATARERPKTDAASPAGEATSTAPAEPALQRYCTVEMPTGSHITRRTCKTRAQWIAEDGFDPTAK